MLYSLLIVLMLTAFSVADVSSRSFHYEDAVKLDSLIDTENYRISIRRNSPKVWDYCFRFPGRHIDDAFSEEYDLLELVVTSVAYISINTDWTSEDILLYFSDRTLVFTTEDARALEYEIPFESDFARGIWILYHFEIYDLDGNRIF